MACKSCDGSGWWWCDIADDEYIKQRCPSCQTAELERLRQWKREALAVLAEWEKVWEAAGRPDRLGASKATATLEYIARYEQSIASP